MYVIMGATGNIGSKLANILLGKSEKITVIGRSAERLQPCVDHGAIAAIGDVADVGFLTKAFKGADAVFALIPPDYQTKDFRKDGHHQVEGMFKKVRPARPQPF